MSPGARGKSKTGRHNPYNQLYSTQRVVTDTGVNISLLVCL